MDIDLDAGIRALDEMIEKRKSLNFVSQGEFISFYQIKQVLEAMRKPEQPTKPEPPLTDIHYKAEIQRLKDRLAEADDLLNNPNTITIDRKVAEDYINSRPLDNGIDVNRCLIKELKRALGEKEVATADDNHTKRIRND